MPRPAAIQPYTTRRNVVTRSAAAVEVGNAGVLSDGAIVTSLLACRGRPGPRPGRAPTRLSPPGYPDRAAVATLSQSPASGKRIIGRPRPRGHAGARSGAESPDGGEGEEARGRRCGSRGGGWPARGVEVSRIAGPVRAVRARPRRS